jgi:2-keto-4-pentenoate hydratase/2-oxohepta-3-ene-1,7-dioic acid hydratase in catechol pathway
MRHARFTDPAGTVRRGEWCDGTVRAAGRTYDRETVDVLPPTEPSKVLGVGRNYREVYDDEASFPNRPRIWWKGEHNVLAGHGDTVALPADEEVVYEAELGVVVGTECRNVDPSAVPDVVAGYTCVNDLSNMDHADDAGFLRVKSFDNAAPMGPVLADPEHVPEQPRVRLWLDGDLQQDSAGDEFVFSVPEMIAEFSQYVTLRPGDVVITGTPADFGPVGSGEHVAIEIEGVGRLEHDIERV